MAHNPIGRGGPDHLHQESLPPVEILYQPGEVILNTREWVLDEYVPGYQAADCTHTPTGNPERVVKGARWDGDPFETRTSHREGEFSTNALPDIGFRCVFTREVVEGQQ